MLSILVLVLLMLGGFYWVFFIPSKKDENYMNQVCETKRIQVKGIISRIGGHGMYHWVEVNNLKKSLSVNVTKIKFIKGITDDYVDCRVGDSIIKKANSKEFMIKRDSCMAVYILSCDD